MAFGDVRGTLTNNTTGATNPFAATGSVSVSAGDLGVLAYSERSTLEQSGNVTDNLGNTWTAVQAAGDSGNATLILFYCYFASGGTLTSVSSAFTASSLDLCASVVIFEGPFKSSPLDKAPTHLLNDAASPFLCPATGTLAQADELIVGAYSAANGVTVAGSTLAASSPMTLQLNTATGTGSGTCSVAIGSWVVSSTATVTPTWTTSTGGGTNVLGTATFMKQSNPAPIPGQGNLALTRDAPSRVVNHLPASAFRDIALSTVAPAIVLGLNPSVAQGNVALSTVAATVFQEHIRLPAQSNLALSAVAPAVVQDIIKLSAQGDLAFSAVAPAVVQNSIIMPAQGNLALSPVAPSALVGYSLAPGFVDITFTSVAPNVSTGAGTAFHQKSSMFAVM